MRKFSTLLLGVLLLVGCQQRPVDKDSKKPHAHPDKGLHGGVLVEWGEEEYHPEVLFDRAKKEATVNIHDGEVKKLVPIKADSITLTLMEEPPVTIQLKAQPREGEPTGTSSRFVGTHEKLGQAGKFAGKVEGKIGDTPYHGTFKEK